MVVSSAEMALKAVISASSSTILSSMFLPSSFRLSIFENVIFNSFPSRTALRADLANLLYVIETIYSLVQRLVHYPPQEYYAI